MKVVVTGGAGFIGSHLVSALLRRKEEVISIDNFDPFYPRGIKELNLTRHRPYSGFSFIEEDILNADALYARLQNVGIDLLIHLAAKAGVRPSLERPKEYHRVNADGTRCMLDLAVRLGVKKVIFASSSSVYGENSNVPWKESDTDLRPISPYATSKIAAETIGREFCTSHGLDFTALRFFTVYGPGQRPDLAIHKFFNNIVEGKPIPVYGDGSTSRDYTYIDDIIAGVLGAVDRKIVPGTFSVFNLGNSSTVRLSELIALIESVVGKKAVIDRKENQPGDVPLTNADISASMRMLGYRPATEIKKGLAQFYEWHQAYYGKR